MKIVTNYCDRCKRAAPKQISFDDSKLQVALNEVSIYMEGNAKPSELCEECFTLFKYALEIFWSKK